MVESTYALEMVKPIVLMQKLVDGYGIMHLVLEIGREPLLRFLMIKSILEQVMG
jgi:hypothetical protein